MWLSIAIIISLCQVLIIVPRDFFKRVGLYMTDTEEKGQISDNSNSTNVAAPTEDLA